ncbi:hypothetical protein [Phenylobacterium sp.]|uniref:hypothetical protein n=1 Tax=Phenylobacterium sp. TaxID=1871053 RepID=UPI0025DC9025|nr:hypothetical protein [Phenylobacterium sp.]MCA3741006.1 hypothetical protein [Phenylobacterium sp.]
MATLTSLLDEHHVMRHVPPAKLRRDADGVVIGFNFNAFALRDGEGYLSAAWVEHAATGEKATDVAATIKAFAAAREVRPSHRYAVGNVGDIRKACAGYNQRPRISHEPVDRFDAHASIRQFNSDNHELLEILAAEAWAEMAVPEQPAPETPKA